VREQSLRNFHHKHEWQSGEAPAEAAARLVQVASKGYKTKLADRDGATAGGQAGRGQQVGLHLRARGHRHHLPGRLARLRPADPLPAVVLGKQAFAGNGIISEIPERYRLGLNNPTFRGNTLIPEGSSSSTAIIRKGWRDDPGPALHHHAQAFIIDLLHRHAQAVRQRSGGARPRDRPETAATIKVNEPLIYKGVAIYQSSFEDGGSKLKLVGYPMRGGANGRFELAGEINGTTALPTALGDYTIEWSGFRPFNVENMQAAASGSTGLHLG
jgi:cytochrome c biogenesis protein